jgi:hypothetical protein
MPRRRRRKSPERRIRDKSNESRPKSAASNLDLALGFVGAAVSVALFIAPRTPISVGVGLVLLFVLLSHPAATLASWGKARTGWLRKTVALLLLALGIAGFGFAIWPSTRDRYPTVRQIADEVVLRFGARLHTILVIPDFDVTRDGPSFLFDPFATASIGGVARDATSLVTRWTWDFGDGTCAVMNPDEVMRVHSGSNTLTHMYISSGTYTVTLSARIWPGAATEVRKSLHVEAPQRPAEGPWPHGPLTGIKIEESMNKEISLSMTQPCPKAD